MNLIWLTPAEERRHSSPLPRCLTRPITKDKTMNTPTPFTAHEALPFIHHLHTKHPLVHCLTNSVVQNFTANVLLAIQASPAMIPAIEEIEDFSHAATALLINVGTVEKHSAQSMLFAAENAHNVGLPWVLDPVAVGVVSFRSNLVRSMLAYKPTVIRGNPSEILYLSGRATTAQGADSLDSSSAALPAAIELAQKHATIVAVTGEVDYITNGQITYAIEGGHVHLTRVTGTGCSLSAMVAAFVGCTPTEHHPQAVATACLMMKKAGEAAATQAQGMGSFAVGLLDALSTLGMDA